MGGIWRQGVGVSQADSGCLLSTAEEQVEIRNGFLAARTHLPVMVIFTPQDHKSSVWTQDGPSAQVQPQPCPQMCGFLPQGQKVGPA